MIINTNISSLNGLNSLTGASNASSKVMGTLSTGKRINSAADDAAGSAVASRMTTQTRGLAQAARNANDGIAMLKTFESAVSSQVDIMQRMRELAVQSANGIYSDADRANLDAEYAALGEEIDRIAEKISFNGNAYISGGYGGDPVKLQISDVANDTLDVTFTASDVATLFAAATGTAGTVGTLATADDSQKAIADIDAALELANTARADFGANINRLEYTVENLNNTRVNLSDAKSRIEDVDMAAAMSELTKQEILTQSSVAMLGKANQAPQAILNLIR